MTVLCINWQGLWSFWMVHQPALDMIIGFTTVHELMSRWLWLIVRIWFFRLWAFDAGFSKTGAFFRVWIECHEHMFGILSYLFCSSEILLVHILVQRIGIPAFCRVLLPSTGSSFGWRWIEICHSAGGVWSCVTYDLFGVLYGAYTPLWTGPHQFVRGVHVCHKDH